MWNRIKKIEDLSVEIERLRNRIWILENPQLYKTGDKIKNRYLVIDVLIQCVAQMGVNPQTYVYRCFDLKENRTKDFNILNNKDILEGK